MTSAATSSVHPNRVSISFLRYGAAAVGAEGGNGKFLRAYLPWRRVFGGCLESGVVVERCVMIQMLTTKELQVVL